MNGTDIVKLVSEYLRDNHGADSGVLLGFVGRADFGWRFASYLAEVRGSPPLLGGSASMWICVAHIYLRREHPFETFYDQKAYVVDRALALHERASKRYILNGMLLCEDADYEEIGNRLGLDAEVVEAYHDLFFSVSGRDPAFLDRAAWGDHPSMFAEEDDNREGIMPFPMVIGRYGSIEDVALAAGLVDPEKPKDRGAHLRLQDLCQRFQNECEPSESYKVFSEKAAREANLEYLKLVNPRPTADQLAKHAQLSAS